jgi:hypothetical protein
MKEKKPNKKINSLLWKFFAVFIVVLALFNIDYKKLSSSKEKEVDSTRPHQQKQEEVVKDDDFDLEDYLLDEIDKEILETIKLEQIKYYRKYIVNLSLVLRKFSDYENYGKEVDFLLANNKSYPREVSELLLVLKSFNEQYLSSKIEQYNDMDLGGGYFQKLVGKIFDIKKVNPQYKVMIEEAEKLKPQLKTLENYFYSVEFLKAHLSYD